MKNRKFVLVPVGGLANRFLAIDSAIALCHRYKRPLEIIWFKDLALNTTFHSLFEPASMPDVTIREANLMDYILYDRPRKKNFFIPRIFQKVIFRKCFYERESQLLAKQSDDFSELASPAAVYIATFVQLVPSELNYSMFKPTLKIKKQIDSVCAQLGDYCIGIHIRRGDNIFSISESPLSLFIERMDHEIALNSSVTFYLATDSDDVKADLVQRYGKRITALNRSADRLSTSGMQDAVSELYILASTRKILGSYYSTFSVLAAKLRGIEYTEIRKENDQ
ncbi:MAG: glycosyl transferase [Bacteroidales bacterium]|nr:glycosyl transferase [Bacteroidales bacterium]